jgi:hypothetical protein
VKCVIGGEARRTAIGVVKCIGYLKAIEIITTTDIGASRTSPLMGSSTAFQPTGRDAQLAYPSARLFGVLNECGRKSCLALYLGGTFFQLVKVF